MDLRWRWSANDGCGLPVVVLAEIDEAARGEEG